MLSKRRGVRRDNVNVHRAAANKLNIESRAARGSVCNVLLSRGSVSESLLHFCDCPV